MTGVAEWARENAGVYFRNAAAVRDYRVQLRGSRSVILWSVYLVVLIGFGMFTYVGASEQNTMSVVEAQGRLQDFYRSILGLLSTMVLLIAPGLTATSIISERQRKSLDLVFSAPVSPKYYLVGKMISSYRYLWMLLVLSIPVTAACVVLGGATWSEVLVSYLLISLHGLIYTAIALLSSTLAVRPVGAVVWAYIGVSTYAIGMSILSGLVMLGSFRGSMSFYGEAPFVVSLMPYSFFDTAATYTVILGYHVPNWALAIVFAVLVVKFMLLAAGSALSPFGSAVTKSLRVHGLVYMLLISFGFSAATGSAMGLVASITAARSPDADLAFGRLLIGLILPLVLVMPVVTCHGVDLERKFWADGVFRMRQALAGTPSGGLPYLWMLVASAVAGIAGNALLNAPAILTWRFAIFTFYALGLVAALWSVGRLTSGMGNLRFARVMQFTFILTAVFLPLPFLSMADALSYVSAAPSVWDLYILRPLFSTGDKTMAALFLGTILFGLGFVVTMFGERMARRARGPEFIYGRS